MKSQMELSVILLFFIIFLVGCKKENSKSEKEYFKLNQPVSIVYDLNKDSQNDFKVDYKWLITDNINLSSPSIIGYLEPLGENQILFKTDEGNLFANLNDTICSDYSELGLPFSWYNFPADIVTYDNITKNSGKWRILSRQSKEYYYLACKIYVDTQEQIGWIKLSIDSSTGIVKLIENNFTIGDYIVIGK